MACCLLSQQLLSQQNPSTGFLAIHRQKQWIPTSSSQNSFAGKHQTPWSRQEYDLNTTSPGTKNRGTQGPAGD